MAVEVSSVMASWGSTLVCMVRSGFISLKASLVGLTFRVCENIYGNGSFSPVVRQTRDYEL